MKAFRIGLVVMAAALVTFGLGGSALAFHDGGVATCDGCHTMHNSLDGAISANGGTVGTGVSTWLTLGSDPSSTCLNCHNGTGSYHMNSTDGSAATPGGDFYWLTKTFTWTAHGHVSSSEADDHGHNVIAADFGLTQDGVLTTAPGGSYSSAFLGCNSCHDPHAVKNGGTKGGYGAIEVSGSYGADPTLAVTGNFRILGDIGYDGGQGAGASFTNDVPIATTAKYAKDADGAHTDFGQGMSEWCANCHTGFTADSSNPMRHPANDDAHLGSTYSVNYNSYVKTGDFTGTSADSYLALVPFERGIADPTALDGASLAGPDASSNVVCLTCHRAHASAFQNATRWDMGTEFPVTDSHPAVGDGGVVGDDVANSYYGRDMSAEFGDFQRSLCNKCHVQD
jgi:general stress protein YciG